jgi:hypothetical protein
MVLQDVSEPSSDFTPDFPTSFDNETPQTPQTSHILLDLSKYPKPIFGWRNKDEAQRTLSERISSNLQVLGRPPTAQEIDAVAYYNCKAISIASYGTPVGVLAGVARFAAVRNTGKWPFVKPHPGFNPYVWPNAKQVWLQGNMARMTHMILRLGVYGYLGTVFAGILFTSYAATSASVGYATDPRLKEYTKKLQENMKGKRMERGRGSAHRQEQVQGVPGGAARMDDASPIAGGDNSFAVDDASSKWEGASGSDSSTGAMEDDRPQMTPSQRSQMIRTKRFTEHRKSLPDQDTASPSTSSTSGDTTDDFYSPSPSSSDYDNASPTARPPSSQSPQSPNLGGSVWDRIRRDAQSNPPSNRRGIGVPRPAKSASASHSGQQEDPSDSFSFSKDEEQHLVKEQAQKEFDLMLDRERKGDESGSGGGGGWRR